MPHPFHLATPLPFVLPLTVPHPSHLGHLLAAAPDGSVLAVAARTHRLAVIPVDVTRPGDTGDAAGGPAAPLGPPVVFMGEGQLQVAGARRLAVGGADGADLESTDAGVDCLSASSLSGGLGTIWDLTFLSGSPDGDACAAAPRAATPPLLAALARRNGELSSEVLLLRWARRSAVGIGDGGGDGGGCGGVLQQVLSVGVPHVGSGALVGVPGRLAPLPGISEGGKRV